LLKPIMYTAKLCYSQPDFSYDFAQSSPYQCRIIWMRLPSMHTTISCSAARKILLRVAAVAAG
jgi:hypothetical protein